jgi:uncharacterized protein
MESTAELVDRLGLRPHPEGGWYREIYRSPTRVQTARGSRSALTTIYYLLEHGQLSRWHVVQADELWHFYGGAPLELLEYDPAAGQFARHALCGATDPASDADTAVAGVGSAGGTPSVAVIPTGVWQAARSLGAYSLVGCTVGPGFEFVDFEFVCDLPSHAEHFKGVLAPFTQLL